jgi:ATP-dependent DNA helicase RecQ
VTTSTSVQTGSGSAVREQAEQILRRLVGRPDAALRDDQWRAIEALAVDRRRALVVQRTGWGKSAVYFVATALLRAAGAGPTIIVSPLLALMRNQIAAAQRAGIRAVTVNSSNLSDWAQVYQAIEAGQVDVLLVSPERLNNPDFRDRALPQLTRATGLVVIDEAHCVSDWGHDFRPDYRRIRTLLAELPDRVPVLATTATANARVTQDVAEQLSVSGTRTLDDVLVLRGSLDRSSLQLGVVELPTAAERLGWLAAHLGELPGAGIIYCLTVAATQQVAEYLRAQGHDVIAYSGQTQEAERLAAEEALLSNRVKALVATSALGMGFDKPDLGFVIHLGAPPSPIAYYQQVGRAGRGVEHAVVVLLPGREDREVWNYFASLAFPPEHLVRQTLRALGDPESAGPTSTQLLETQVDLGRTRLEMMLKVLDVDGAVHRVRGGWVATGRPWSYDEQRYERVRATRQAEQGAMLDYVSASMCRLQFLREALDDEGAARCGRCDRCGGLRLPLDVDSGRLEAASRRLDEPGVPVDPRRMWPGGMASLGVRLSGRIPSDEQAGEGRAVARLTDLGWGEQVRALFAPGTPDGEVPVPLRHAVVQVIKEWGPGRPEPMGPGKVERDTVRPEKVGPEKVQPERPFDGIVFIDSRRRPQLVSHLATGLARYFAVPLLTRFSVVGDAAPGQGSANSAQRLHAVAERYRLDEPEAVVLRRVLLIDDQATTGWTLAVTSRLLRLAGAAEVHPLVIATT